jgi:hypothetical protein
MDPVQNAKDEMGGLEKAIAGLPGIKGYREKELRREADKQVRDNLARHLDGPRRRLVAVQNELVSAGGLDWVDDVERVIGRLQLFIDRVKTASYGYAPLFGLNRVDEEDLDRLAAFDQDLYNQAGPLEEAIGKLEQAVSANNGIKDALKVVDAQVSAMNDTFNRRAEVIQGASA